MRYTDAGIDVMNCVRNSRHAAAAVQGSAALNRISSAEPAARSGRREERVMRRERAEIIDFGHAAGYTIAENGFGYRETSDRKRTQGSRRNSGRKAARARRARRSLKMLFAGVLLGVLMTLGAGMITRASTVAVPSASKYYETVVVQYGDTADEIIERYWDPAYSASREGYEEEFCRINSLEKDSSGRPYIHPGQHLFVPCYTETPAQ